MFAEQDAEIWWIFIAVMVVTSLAYWIPAAVAFIRHHPDRWWILLVNALLGCTIIGWFIALAWSCSKIVLTASNNTLHNETTRPRH